MIPITKPFLPPKEEYLQILNEIWDRNWLTNNGPVLVKLEAELKEFLNVSDLMIVSNGTIALQLAIKSLNLTGEILTTPFSYVATTSSIVWENCTPIFIDINEKDFNINSDLITERITDKTQAIMATHVFGNACNIEKIQTIARKHKLKVIYDAAHCFGTIYKGRSIFSYGDITTTSFHATKMFNTIEGGAIFNFDKKLGKKLRIMRNFGHESPIAFSGVGINAKNSEVHAAMGIASLPYMNDVLKTRKKQWLIYQELLGKVPNLQLLHITENTEYNHSYFPVVFKNEEVLLRVIQGLNNHYVYPRRYFYPSLNTLNYVDEVSCPVSESISQRVLTLPLYHDLQKSSIELICKVLIENL